MSWIEDIFRRSTAPRGRSPIGSYSVKIVSLPEELDWEDRLPLELRFILSRDPGVKEKLRKLLSEGKAIGVRTVEAAPENVLKAVKDVSQFSQHNCVLTWLPALLRDKHLPHFTPDEAARAADSGADLRAGVETILENRHKFKRLVLVDEENVGIGSEEQRLMSELSELLYPVSIDYIVHRIVVDNANERTEVAQAIIKALLVIGPISHVLEHWVSGIGKVFAASTDDVLGEAAEIMALRGSGFAWREMTRRFKVLIPVFALAVFGSLMVGPLIDRGFVLLGGAVFGLSAVALSLTTAIQSVGMYRQSVDSLVAEGKFRLPARWSVWRAAFIQDFTNPARLGLLLGAAAAPFFGMLASLAGLMSNGWILALVGSTETVVAGLTVIFSNRLTAWRFRRRLSRMINS